MIDENKKVKRKIQSNRFACFPRSRKGGNKRVIQYACRKEETKRGKKKTGMILSRTNASPKLGELGLGRVEGQRTGPMLPYQKRLTRCRGNAWKNSKIDSDDCSGCFFEQLVLFSPLFFETSLL